MIDCKDCEHFKHDVVGNAQFSCNPFTSIKEPECIAKLQLLKLDAATRQLEAVTMKLDTMVQAYQSTLSIYRRLAPMQEKMFRHMEREIDEVDESEKWKLGYDDDPEEDDDDPMNAC